MALMAGILFTATFLVFGTSTFVSPARIYPPNEGKVVGRKEVPWTFDFIPAPRVFAPRSRTSWPLVASAWSRGEFNGGKHRRSPLRVESGTRSGCPNAQRLFLVSARAWIVPAAESLGSGILVAPIRAGRSVRREGQADLSSEIC